MPHRPDPETFGFLITDTARLIRAEFDRLIGEANLGVTPGEARALAHVARAEPVRQTVLADRMGLEAMTLSIYLDRLEARDLVARSPDPADRRAKLVRTTGKADATLRQILQVGDVVRHEAAEGLDEAEWLAFLSLLKRLRGNLCARRQESGRARPAA